MSKSLGKSRIPYIAACNGVRFDPITGCGNDASICAVRGMGLCWAEKLNLDKCGKCEFNAGVGGCDLDDHCTVPHFKPTFHPEALEAPLRTRKPYVIFTGFGGDMWSDGVDPEWRRQIFEVERACPQHTFVHLTKTYHNLDSTEIEPMQGNWFGLSVCNLNDVERLSIGSENAFIPHGCHWWISFEPILENTGVRTAKHLEGIDFVVAGGLSDGNGKVVSPEDGGTRAEYIQPIVDAAYEAHIPLFLKNIDGIWRKLINPRTGKPMESPYAIRELPEAWVTK